VLDSATNTGTLPGALLRTLVAHQVNAFTAREVVNDGPRRLVAALGFARQVRRVADADTPKSLACQSPPDSEHTT
jgi:hypothetical protein